MVVGLDMLVSVLECWWWVVFVLILVFSCGRWLPGFVG